MLARSPLPAGLLALLAICGAAAARDVPSVPDEVQLLAMTARFAPADIGANVKKLPESERRALVKLVEAEIPD